MHYLIESTLILATLILVYLLLIKHQSQHDLKRAGLLGFAAFSILAPLLTISVAPESVPVIMSTQLLQEVTIGQFAAATPEMIETTNSFQWSWMMLYYAGLIVAGLAFAYKLLKIGSLIKKTTFRSVYSTQQKISFKVANASEVGGSFSFFCWMFLDETVAKDQTEKDFLYEHELAHIRLRHSWDILFAEMMQVVFWFNPLVYVYKRELKLVHELQADQAAAFEKQPYINLLMKEVVGSRDFALTHSFFEMPIKIRIKALLTKTQAFNVHRWWPVIPVVLLLGVVSVLETKDLSHQHEAGMASTFALQEIDRQAAPKKGMNAFYKFLNKHVEYPAWTKAAGVEGKVFVQFTVQPDGALTQVEVVRGLVDDINESCIAAIKKAPRWEPAIVNGEPVATRMVIPISFGVDEDRDIEKDQSLTDSDAFPIGGYRSFYEYLDKEIKIPDEVREQKMQGSVFVEFTIEEDGELTGFEVVRSVNDDLDKECVRVLDAAPNWIPKRVKGQGVASNYTLPIKFYWK